MPLLESLTIEDNAHVVRDVSHFTRSRYDVVTTHTKKQREREIKNNAQSDAVLGVSFRSCRRQSTMTGANRTGRTVSRKAPFSTVPS